MLIISYKEINRLAVPAIFAGIAEPLIGLVDTAIIGHIGSSELGAVGIASSFFLLVVWVLAQTKSAISAIVSKYYGAKQTEELHALIPQAVFINVALGFILFVVTGFFAREIFASFYGIDNPEVLQHAVDYFSIRSIGFPLTLGAFSIFGVFRGLQNTKWAMQISVVGGLANLVFDVLLVYGIPGLIPELGLKGAAWASLIAQALMFLLAIYYLYRHTNFGLRLSAKMHGELKRLIGLSSNLIVRTLALNVAYFMANYFANSYGEKALAAHTAAMQVWLFSAFFIDGYANAGNALSGRLLGEKNFPALAKLSVDLTKISVLIAIGLSVVYLIGYQFAGRLFSDDAEVLWYFNQIYWIVILMQPINAVAFAFDGIYKGLGEAALLRNVLLLGTLFGYVPVIFVCDQLEIGLYSVWVAFAIWMAVRGGTLWIHFNWRWKNRH